MGEELVLGGELGMEGGVVVDLTINWQGKGLLLVEQWLSTIVETNNGKTLVAKDVVPMLVHATPVWATMAEPI